MLALLASSACAEDPTGPPELAFQWATVIPGAYQTCGLDTEGRAYCWGELGRGYFEDEGVVHAEPQPVPQTNDLRFTNLTVGAFHVCALTDAGEAYCWGGNEYGQLGSGTLDGYSDTPLPVETALRFRAIEAAAYATCGLVQDGRVYCWGVNSQVQLGTTDDRLSLTCEGVHDTFGCTPVPVAAVEQSRFASISSHSGAHAVCGITTAGVGQCWGSNHSMQLGVEDAPWDCLPSYTDCSPVPVTITGGVDFDSVSVGGDHACGLAAGAAYCWGGNYHAALGIEEAWSGERCYSNLPGCFGFALPVSGGLQFDRISAGRFATCGITSAGSAWCWGHGRDGVLGNGTDVTARSPVAVAGAHRFRDVRIGLATACGVTLDGAAWCWGANNGMLGDGTLENRSIPTRVLDPVLEI